MAERFSRVFLSFYREVCFFVFQRVWPRSFMVFLRYSARRRDLLQDVSSLDDVRDGVRQLARLSRARLLCADGLFQRCQLFGLRPPSVIRHPSAK